MLRGIEKIITYLIMIVIVVFAFVFLVKQLGITTDLKESLVQAKNAGFSTGDLHKITQLHQSSARIFFLSFFSFFLLLIGLVIIMRGIERAYDISEVKEKVRHHLKSTTPGIVMVVLAAFLLVFSIYRSSNIEATYSRRLVDFNSYKVAIEGFNKPANSIVRVDSSVMPRLKKVIAKIKGSKRDASAKKEVKKEDIAKAPVKAIVPAPVAKTTKPAVPVPAKAPAPTVVKQEKKASVPAAKPAITPPAVVKNNKEVPKAASKPAVPPAVTKAKEMPKTATTTKPGAQTPPVAKSQKPIVPAPRPAAPAQPVAKSQKPAVPAAKPVMPAPPVAKNNKQAVPVTKPATPAPALAKKEKPSPVVASKTSVHTSKDKPALAAKHSKAPGKEVPMASKPSGAPKNDIAGKTSGSKGKAKMHWINKDKKEAVAKADVKRNTDEPRIARRSEETDYDHDVDYGPVTSADIEWARSFQKRVTIFGHNPSKSETRRYHHVYMKTGGRGVSSELHWAYSFLEKTKRGYEPKPGEMSTYERIVERNVSSASANGGKNSYH